MNAMPPAEIRPPATNVAPRGSKAALPEPLLIHGAQLELRSLCASDAPLYVALYTDPQTMRFIGPALTRRQAARSFRAALRSRDPPLQGPLYITIIERTSQQPLGLCAIQQIARCSAEVGVIISAAARGRGIATESLKAVIGWALDTLPLDHIWVRISAHNRIAELLVRSLGLVRQAFTTELLHTQPSEVIWSADRNSWP